MGLVSVRRRAVRRVVVIPKRMGARWPARTSGGVARTKRRVRTLPRVGGGVVTLPQSRLLRTIRVLGRRREEDQSRRRESPSRARTTR